MSTHESTHVILVAGNWLGGWAWDEVVPGLRAGGLEPHPVTLPGLAPGDDPRPVTRDDHVAAVTDLVDSLDGDVALVGHSGGGAVVGAVLDRRPERVRRAVFVDSGPLVDGAALDPTLPEEVESVPLPSWAELTADGASIDGIDDAHLAAFRDRALPHPARVVREPVRVSDPRRFTVSVTAVCTSLPSPVLQTMLDGGPPFHTELGRYDDVTYVDLPTGHWPMFSRPGDLAGALVDAVRTR